MKKAKFLFAIVVLAVVSSACNRVVCPSAAGSNDLPVPEEMEQKSV